MNRLFTAWCETRLPRPAALGDRAAADGTLAGRAPRSRSRIPRSCARRSCGPSTGSSARTPRSACSAAPTRSATCPWPAGRSSASSIRSTCRSWRSAGTGSPHGLAVPQKIGRHSHPKAKPEQPGIPPPADRDRLPRPHPGRARAGRPPGPDPLRRPRAAARTRTGGGRPVTAVPAAQVSAVLAWAARLAAAGPRRAPPRPPPTSPPRPPSWKPSPPSATHGGWSPEDIAAARDAAARAREGGRHRRPGRRGRHHQPGGLTR